MVPINGSGLTRVALLNDFSCFGKCSLTVSIPIISSYGIETVPLPTAVLSTHTGGFDRFVMRDMTEDMRQIAAHWKEMDMQFDCIYTGFFPEYLFFFLFYISNVTDWLFFALLIPSQTRI